MTQKEETIWTDSYKTKDLIWEAYAGYITHYNNYITQQTIGRDDMITIAALKKYANYFYEEIRNLLDKFNIKEKEITQAKELLEQEKELTKKDYTFLRRFFADFMHHSGIKNISIEKQDPSNAIEDDLFG